jgi:hypothetical protein
MRTLRALDQSFVVRCVVVAAALLLPVACKSGRDDSAGAPSSASSTSTTNSTSSTSTSTTTSTTTTTLPPTTTTEPLVTEGGIVKVANASGIDGAAGRLTAELAALGFATNDATNAAGIDKDLQISKIYVVQGSEAVAASVSRVMGGLAVTRMPTPAWISGGTAGLEGATVLVMLGHDLAGTALADMT